MSVAEPLSCPGPSGFERKLSLVPFAEVWASRIETRTELREYLDVMRRNRFSVGLVPTMGSFHEGHLSLFRAAREDCDKVVASLFVNPAQFGPEEDLERYPRDVERDRMLAEETGVDVFFVPGVEEIYVRGGLEEGERVCLSPLEAVTDGMQVRTSASAGEASPQESAS